MQPKITRREIARLTAKAFDADLEQIAGPSRSSRQCRARYAVWYLVKERMPSASLFSLGDLAGGKDHTTVLHGLARATHFLAVDADFRGRVEAARKAIAEWRPAPPVMVSFAPPAAPLPIRAERPPERKSEPSTPTPQPSRECPYQVWLRETCAGSEARFLDIAMREHPNLVRVPQIEAAE